ncbi:hypothetical protein Tco_0652559 [Tanacetum coccineum]|uniref:Uncharacterized protein n=1 Tax=Tanacetum coccineum TaxID=301880 RepID=A0ABQ4WYM7_9ASTR
MSLTHLKGLPAGALILGQDLTQTWVGVPIRSNNHTNTSEKGHYARNFPKPRVRDSKYFMEQMLLAKKDEAGVILSNEQNDVLIADAA